MPHDEHDERRDPECPECIAEYDAAAQFYGASYRAEAQRRESLALARADLDMPNASIDELMEAIQRELK